MRPCRCGGAPGTSRPLARSFAPSLDEVAKEINGWAIGDGREFKSLAKQNRYDADSIYDLLETRIVPEFYTRDRSGLPRRWIDRMRNSIATVGAEFNTHRMVGEYFERFYLPASS